MPGDQSSADEILRAACDQANEELRAMLREICQPQPRFGWKRSRLDEQQREYIIQRQQVLEAIGLVREACWQSIDLCDRELALKMKENALHALATLAMAMRANEGKIL